MKCIVTAPTPTNCVVYTDTKCIYKYNPQSNTTEKLLESEISINSIDYNGELLAYTTVDKQVHVNGNSQQLGRKSSIIKFEDNQLLILERDGALLEYDYTANSIKVPEFGRSVTLTAYDQRRIGDRDGIVCQVGARFGKIQQIWVVPGYVNCIKNNLVSCQSGIYDVQQDKLILEAAGIDTLLIQNDKVFYIQQCYENNTAKANLCSLSNGQVTELFTLPLIELGKIRKDVPCYELVNYQDDFLIIGKLNGQIYNSAGQIINQANAIEADWKMVNEQHVVRMHYQGQIIQYE
ncbi:WD40-repeat-containing_domain superfamily [Hexamita inflata]|uniref:WD40-repeat-containing domain superfamily n=1 Tax=Hexamita inflata TaxID=28002 RepID=A0AA86U6E3_9EUKA|nr:WD40-repeat-containing domain superfamily [Hexamita inflata]